MAEFTCLIGTIVRRPTIPIPTSAALRRHHQRPRGQPRQGHSEAKAAHGSRMRGRRRAWPAHPGGSAGAIILAKAKNGPDIAAASIDHLRRYVELLFKLQTRRTDMSTAQHKTRTAQQKNDEAAIRELIENWSRAVKQRTPRDRRGLHATDRALRCDPALSHGRQRAIAALWAQCFPLLPGKFRSEHKDLDIEVSGDVAFVHGCTTSCRSRPIIPAARPGCA